MAAINLLRDLLRSPDEVKGILEATLVTSSVENQDPYYRRILAVVSHKDDWDLTEEGSVFICKYKSTVNGRPEELEIQRVLPIYGDFSITISQTRRGTVEPRPTVSTKSLLEQPRAVITLGITPAEGLQDEGQPAMFFTQDIESLKRLTAECKRLKEVSDVDANAMVNLASSTTHFSWLRPYLEKDAIAATLTSVPQDIRQYNIPLLERLSPGSAGFVGDDHADAKIIKEDWVRAKAREMARTGRRHLSLRLGTFNVNGKMPSQDLSTWVQRNVTTKYQVEETPSLPPVNNVSPLSLGEILKNPFTWNARKTTPASTDDNNEEGLSLRVDTTDPEDPDLIVLGFQEIDLSTEALIYSTGTSREDAWCLAVLASLGEKGVKYEKLISKQLVGMLIVIFVKKILKDSFTEIGTSAAGAGIMGIMGNKGGTAVRLAFTPSTFESSTPDKTSGGLSGPTIITFVNAHLAAFDDMVDRRNSDFQDLSKRLTFDGTSSVSSSTTIAEAESEEHVPGQIPSAPAMGLPPRVSIYETDALFWMLINPRSILNHGVVDLNYRVDIPDPQMRKILCDTEWDQASKLTALLRFDQLKKAMLSKKAFEGFHEANITHIPTYRFSPGIMMDELGYDLKRRPAWTDRILHMHGPACKVTQLSYTSHPQILMSDHRPVAADFAIDIDLYNIETLYMNVRKLLHSVHQIDGEGTQERGGLKVEDTYVDFDKVLYGVPVERKITVRNTSRSPCAFRFVPAQADTPFKPEWLNIYPTTGILLPADMIEIILRIEVNSYIASILNLRPKDLSCTLILHTVLGKDHFISVSGEYHYTCFANKLSRITRLRGPIRSMESPNDLLPENNPINAPREVMRLVNWMMTNSKHTDEMFLSPSDATIVQTIRECLDTGDEFPYIPNTASDIEMPVAFAGTLLALLESLPDSIIPAPLHSRCLEMTNRDEAFELLDALSPASVNVWISITAFLHFICQASQETDHATRIAKVIAPVLIRDDVSSLTPPISPVGKCNFLLYFIS